MAAIPQPKVAFFCMEYGLDETFTIYSGGLGVLAGDILKTARDLDLPFVGIGILWNEGYSDQFLDKNGFPQHCRQNYDRPLGGHRAHRQSVDSRRGGYLQGLEDGGFQQCPLVSPRADLPGTSHGWITRQLYASSPQERVAAEMVLGIGGCASCVD